MSETSSRESAVMNEKIDVQLIHPTDLINTLGGSGAEKGKVRIPSVETQLHSVKAALHCGEGEIADQSLSDARIDQIRKGLILRMDFRTIEKREATQPYVALRREVEPDVGLLQESAGRISSTAVGREVRPTQAKLPQHPGLHSSRRQIKDAIRRALQEPLERFGLLADPNFQQGMFKSVCILAFSRLEEVPCLGSEAPVDGDVQWP